MYLRIYSTALLFPLAACGAQSPVPPGEAVECAIGAGADFSSVCTLELAGEEIILHHPDGGFRRLARDSGTDQLAPRDGAEPLVIEAGGEGAVQFAIGEDRYRISRALLAPVRR